MKDSSMTDNTIKTYYPLPICKGKVGQPRAVMYANGVFKASSELEQMIIAFGPDYMNMLLENAIYKVQTELRNDQRKGLRLTEKKRVRVKANRKTIECSDENIYGLASIEQSIREDRKYKRRA